MHYGVEELEQDLVTVRELRGEGGQANDKPWLALRGSARFVGDPVAPVDSGAEVDPPPKEGQGAGS